MLRRLTSQKDMPRYNREVYTITSREDKEMAKLLNNVKKARPIRGPDPCCKDPVMKTLEEEIEKLKKKLTL